jgi:pilus assembly protein CpaB
MNQRFISVLVFAFIVAAGASLLLYRLMAARVPAKGATPTTKVILAARNLELGTLIRDPDVKVGDWSGNPPPGSVLKKEDVVGRGIIAATYEGEPLLESRLAPKGAGGGLAAMIPSGMRAVAVRVNEVVGVAGFVVPGMRVDVLISGTPPNGAAGMGSLTKTMLQNIEVLSAGQDFKKDAEGKPVSVQVVNLLVTPEQAEQLSLAINQTTIQLILRNPLDTQISKTTGTALGLLYGQIARPTPQAAPVAPSRPRPKQAAAPPPALYMAPPPKPQPFVIEMIHGNKKVEQKFQGAAAEDK